MPKIIGLQVYKLETSGFLHFEDGIRCYTDSIFANFCQEPLDSSALCRNGQNEMSQWIPSQNAMNIQLHPNGQL